MNGYANMTSRYAVLRQPAIWCGANIVAGVLAFVLPFLSESKAYTAEDNQAAILGNVALAIAAYHASVDKCYYDVRDGKIFSDADTLFSRRLPNVWPALREAAPDSLPMLLNTAHIIAGKSDCVAYGTAVGGGLVAALYTGQLDASVGAEMDRLTKGGGRGKTDPAPAAPAPITAPLSAAETERRYNAEHPNLNNPAANYGSKAHMSLTQRGPIAPAPAMQAAPLSQTPTSDACAKWAASQDPDTIERWGTQDGGGSSRDKAILRLTLSCLGDEAPEIVGFYSSVGVADAYCEKHTTAGICTSRGAAASPGNASQAVITVRTENYPRPPYSGATYYLYERDGKTICTKYAVCNKFDECDNEYFIGNHKELEDVQTGAPYDKTPATVIPNASLSKHVCLTKFGLIQAH